MALTKEEKKNLSRNLKKLVPDNETKQALFYVTGIKQRTYETYLYGERGPSPKALKAIADYFQTTPELLLSKDMVSDAIRLRKMLRNYYPIWLDRTTPKDEQILDMIRQNFGIRGNAGKILYSFLTLIKAAGFNIRVRPEYSDEEVLAYHKATSGRDDDILDAREGQYELKYFRFEPLPLEDGLKQKFDEISSTPEYKHLIELLDEDNTTVNLTVKQEQFIKRAKDGEYTKELLSDVPIMKDGEYTYKSLRTLPLTFIITLDKNNDGLSSEQIGEQYMKAEFLDDFFYMIAEVPIADMLDIQEKFLKEPFKDGDTFLDFIDSELDKFKIRKAGA